MSKVGSLASSNADFERFVYADVATEPNGMELSVLSALSRQGLDPWQEAQRLAQLPSFAAADGLAQILRPLPAVQALRETNEKYPHRPGWRPSHAESNR